MRGFQSDQRRRTRLRLKKEVLVENHIRHVGWLLESGGSCPLVHRNHIETKAAFPKSFSQFFKISRRSNDHGIHFTLELGDFS